MKMDYIPVGDYCIPNLELPQESRPIGKWGRMHRRYLETYHPIRFNQLVLSGTLWTYLVGGSDRSDVDSFCYGNIQPAEEHTSSAKEYKAALQRISRNEESLQETLTDAQRKLFAQYLDSVREFQDMAE